MNRTMEKFYDLKKLMEHVNDLIEVCPSSIKQEPREKLEAVPNLAMEDKLNGKEKG